MGQVGGQRREQREGARWASCSALAGDDRQGVRAAPPRPADLRHDARHADHAARCCSAIAINTDPQAPADGGAGADQSGCRARSIARALGNTGYFDFVARGRDRGGGRRAAAAGRGAVRRHHPGRLHPPLVRGDEPQIADRGRRHRSRGHRRRAGGGPGRCAAGAGPRPEGRARRRTPRARRRSRW